MTPTVADIQDKKRLLFVDDEPSILDGLRRSLRPLRDEWDLDFAHDGPEALERLKTRPADLVVSDLRMPGMNGVELLGAVKSRYPSTARFVLSGFADQFMVLHCAGPAHRFLAKPCAPEDLVHAIRRSFALRDRLHAHAVQRFMDSAEDLPTLPGLYESLMRALQSPDSTMAEIAAIIDHNPGMAAKMLHLVNSAFFVYIESIQQAISYLGAEAMSAVALAAALFEPCLDPERDEFGLQACYDHSIAVGATAGTWISRTFQHRRLAEESIMAGMTHDIGKLVLMRNRPDGWRETLQAARRRRLPVHLVEADVLGVTHADIGACLLNRWGIADPIVEAVAYHHHPSGSLSRDKGSLFAVHVANALCHKWHEAGADWKSLLDTSYLNAVDPGESIDDFEVAAGRS